MNDNIAPSMSGLGWDWRRRLLIDVVAQTDRIGTRLSCVVLVAADS